MTQLPRIAHIGIAVENLGDALAFYRDVLGIEPRAHEAADGATIVSLPFGGPEVELLEPVTPDGPIARFPTSTPPCSDAAPPATGCWTKRPAPAPTAAALPSCTPSLPPAS
jgi:catechol 2,3-dioxygenase-like lactoylglutathione lyase family enzyme